MWKARIWFPLGKCQGYSLPSCKLWKVTFISCNSFDCRSDCLCAGVTQDGPHQIDNIGHDVAGYIIFVQMSMLWKSSSSNKSWLLSSLLSYISHLLNVLATQWIIIDLCWKQINFRLDCCYFYFKSRSSNLPLFRPNVSGSVAMKIDTQNGRTLRNEFYFAKSHDWSEGWLT